MNNNIEQLAKIYNAMLTIHTNGEDTMTMADCLRALRQVVEEMASQEEENKEG